VLNSLYGATLSATREFVGLARVLNSFVVVAMITQHRELLNRTWLHLRNHLA
jgi:phage-related holin